MGYWGRPRVITRVLIKGDWGAQSQRRGCEDRSRGWGDVESGANCCLWERLQASRNWEGKELMVS